MAGPTPFSRLSWHSRLIERLPGDPEKDLFTRQVPGASYSEVRPTPVRAPRLLAWSERLGAELGIARPLPSDRDTISALGGNFLFPGMRPYAARYGGHQFGNWAGQLGDGRAITLGEAETAAGPMEFQLKGAGPTPYSRRADGRAVLRSSVREFLCSEALHFLGIPTTRALSLVSTGEQVVRDLFYDGNPKPEPGAIVCRVSPSFLRFGNFEILAASGELELLKKLADLLIADHYPDLSLEDPDVYGALLDRISRQTAALMIHWMRVGFVHGVMNTDNMSALSLTIDYGPYGWLEPYEPGWTPNTTDAQGRRYCYGNQPGIAFWNLQRLCEAFLPLVREEARLHRTLAIYKETFEQGYVAMLARKLGLASIASEEDQKLIEETLELLQVAETDFTLFFRALCDWKGHGFVEHVSPAFYAPPARELQDRWTRWSERYAAKLARDGAQDSLRVASMKKTNPKYVLRNYLAQNAIVAAEKDDLAPLERLLRVLEAPYDEQPGEEDLAQRRPEWARNAPGCSALSCSS